MTRKKNKRFPLQTFTKVSAVLVLWALFKSRIYHQRPDSKKKYKYIKGPVIMMGNHTSIWDPVFVGYTFLFRQFRVLAGEMLYRKNNLFSWFLDKMGFIRVDRNITDLTALQQSMDALESGAMLGVFPEGRINVESGDLLPFKPGIVMIALKTGAPIIPIYTDGVYKMKRHTSAIIGEKIYLRDYLNPDIPYEDAIQELCEFLRDRMRGLRELLNQRKAQQDQ